MELQTERRCPHCDRPIKNFDRMKGGRCIACNQSASLGERDDERRIVAPALANVASEPAPSLPSPAEVPPAAAALVVEPCVRCERAEGVFRNGTYSGYCARCIESARQWCKRTGASPTPQGIKERLVLAEPFGAPRKPPRRERPAKSPSAGTAIRLTIPGCPSYDELTYAAPAWVFEMRRLVTAPRRILTERGIETAIAQYCLAARAAA